MGELLGDCRHLAIQTPKAAGQVTMVWGSLSLSLDQAVPKAPEGSAPAVLPKNKHDLKGTGPLGGSKATNPKALL